MTVSEEIQTANIRHQVYLQRYSTQIVNRIIRLLNRVDKSIVERLLEDDMTSLSRSRLEKLLDQLRVINVEAYKVVNGEFRKELREFAKYEAGFQSKGLQAALPMQWDVITPAPQQLYSAVAARPFQGRLLKEWTQGLEANAFNRLRDAVRMAVVEGTTTAELVRQVRGTRANNYRDGILQISRRGAEAMVRTALNHTASVARAKLYEENLDLIKAEAWVSTLDGKTSAVCRSRDGNIYEVGKGPRPPAHINCRSITTPVLKSWKELGFDFEELEPSTRASMNGQVPSRLNFEEWLKTQPKDFQDDVLGVAKGKLFRKGELPLDRFVDYSGREYTLDELRKRDAEAIERADL